MKDGPGLRVVLALSVCAIGIVSALALEEGDDASGIAEPQAGSASGADASKPGGAKRNKPVPYLSMEKLSRQSAQKKTVDLFAVASWQAPAAALPQPVIAQPAPPPPPVAPPLPFAYMGKFTEPSGKVVVYLGQGDKAHTVSVGDTVGGTYRVEALDSKQLTFTYVPLDIKQTLPIGNAP
jgi:hypothetical protein